MLYYWDNFIQKVLYYWDKFLTRKNVRLILLEHFLTRKNVRFPCGSFNGTNSESKKCSLLLMERILSKGNVRLIVVSSKIFIA